MVLYRVFREDASFGERSGESVELENAIKMAKTFSQENKGANFVVEKVEEVWEVKPQKHTSNAIHASIRDEHFGSDYDGDS
jgi:hypothetical protein